MIDKKRWNRITDILAGIFAVIFVVVFTIVILLFVYVAWTTISTPVPISRLCADAKNVTQQCIDYRIDQCMATERYTLGQCVTLVGK